MEKASAFRKFFNLLDGKLDERTRRLAVAAASQSLPYGGATAVAKVAGVSRSVIYDGIKELKRDGGIEKKTTKNRQRRPGSGPKFLMDKDGNLVKDLDGLIQPYEHGDPESCLRWTCRSLRNICGELRKKGHSISHVTVGKMLEQLGYTLQSNKKSREGGSHLDRDAQFRHIHDCVEAFVSEFQPVISVDAKKKELIGDLKNAGREYRPKGQPAEVEVYDFINENGRATPYGIYDIGANEGFVNVGISHDTASFAVDSIWRWWSTMGSSRYQDAHSLYINADGGGSNGSSNKLWKLELQRFANDCGLNVYVSHFPPGTSKWNKIEHRMFSFISMNWRGKPLSSVEVMVNLIASTTTKPGLRIKAEASNQNYQTGKKVSNEMLDKVNMIGHEFHSEWNYVIMPNLDVEL